MNVIIEQKNNNDLKPIVGPAYIHSLCVYSYRLVLSPLLAQLIYIASVSTFVNSADVTLSPEKKRKSTATTAKKMKPSPTPQSISILSLPHELLLSCLARVSRLYYPTLSLVSKSFRSIISSPELYKARSDLGKTESCLYVCMHFYRDRNPTWFTLCLKPAQTLTNCNSKEEKKKKKSSAYVLAKVRIPNSPSINVSGLVSVGSCIYNIARDPFFHQVSILDCRSHTWQDSPSLPVEVRSLTTSVMDAKIYVAGCYKDEDESMNNCLEIFDTKTKIWDLVPVSCLEAKEIFYHSQSVSIDGKLHVKTGLQEVAAYSPKEGIWKLAGDNDAMREFMLHPDSYCVIGNVLYSVYQGVFRWYDSKVNKWRYLKGSGGRLLPDNVRLRVADNGGKMLVLWHELVQDDSEKMIWFAEIKLVRREGLIFGGYLSGVIMWLRYLVDMISLKFFLLLFDEWIRHKGFEHVFFW